MDELIKVTYNNGNPLPEFNNAAQVSSFLNIGWNFLRVHWIDGVAQVPLDPIITSSS